MHEILHKVAINTNPQALYAALTEDAGLSAWWSRSETNHDLTTIFFGPEGEHQVKMRHKAKVPEQKVVWQCESGPWQETGEFLFEIKATEQGCDLYFSHQGWPAADDFYRHCNSKWGYFFTVSLKPYLETGQGTPHPHDSNI